MGPAVTAQYGGIVMWLAGVSIFFQVIYNLEVMRYTLYCGEPVFVGFFRVRPGPRFWTVFYICIDFFAIWPYLASNAAVPLNAALLGHLPGALPTEYMSVEEVASSFGLSQEVVLELKEHPERFGSGEDKKLLPTPIAAHVEAERKRTHWLAYGVFLVSFVPLIFGGKIYNSLERLMVVKIILVLGYLTFLGLFFVSWDTWIEIFAGFVFLGKDAGGSWGFRLFPETAADGAGRGLDWALLAAFAAIAGQGGMTNAQLSTYARDKGWGMGKLVGAVPSIVGGKGITLSHTGKVFRPTVGAVDRWRGWMRVIRRDQWVIWCTGCVLGVAIPALVSLQFVRGMKIRGDQVAAATAQGIVNRTEIQAFWFLTLLCGFIVLMPSQVSQMDGLFRRWTDVLWTGNARLRQVAEHKVKYVYYGLLLVYSFWGLAVLTLVPQQDKIIKISAVFMNFALGFSSFHTLAVNNFLLPRALRPGWLVRASLTGCGLFFFWISYMGLMKLLAEYGR
jgi:hypothetical protein